MYLLLSCRKLVLGTTIDYGGVGAKPQGCSRGIHRHVSSTDDTALLPGVDRGEIVLAESLHKVVSRQELIGGENPVEILARNAHEFRQTGSRADKHSLEAFLVHQLVDGDRPSDNHIGLYFDSERLDSVDLALEDGVLRKPELRDAIFQHTAGLVEGFEDRDIVAFLGQVGGAGQACRSGTDDGNLRAARGRSGWRLDRIGAGRGRVVGHKPLQFADGHRLTLDTEDAAALALALLRADTSADGRKGGVLGDDGGGSGDVTCGHLGDANIHDELRKIYARTKEAKQHGFKAGDFSYNTGKLRCPVCDGTGSISLDVQFLPDVDIPCPECRGSRYGKQAKLIRYTNKDGEERSLPELMNMDVNTAVHYCRHMKSVRPKLEILRDLGLGYLTLGEETPSLSGGEAQRLKLASEMGRKQTDSVFVFDEPTIGLHPKDVETLLKVFATLIDNGATVIVIEHDLDVIRSADYLIDMGPEGGADGGRIVACGSQEDIRNCKESITGKFINAQTRYHE